MRAAQRNIELALLNSRKPNSYSFSYATQSSVNLAVVTDDSSDWTVDWGDGTVETYASGTSYKAHTYSTPQSGEVKLTFAEGVGFREFRSTINSFDFDIANLPSGLTYYINYGQNTTHGDIASLPSGLTYYYSTGSNTTHGDIANLPSGLTYYINYGQNTTHGDIASLPSGLTYYRNYGQNTTHGDIANLPSGLTLYRNYGQNTTHGDIANLPSGLTYYYNTGSNEVSDYTQGRTWTATVEQLVQLPAAGFGLDSSEVDNLLIDLSNTSFAGSAIIKIDGNNAPRTSASDAAVATLVGKGVTVTTN